MARHTAGGVVAVAGRSFFSLNRTKVRAFVRSRASFRHCSVNAFAHIINVQGVVIAVPQGGTHPAPVATFWQVVAHVAGHDVAVLVCRDRGQTAVELDPVGWRALMVEPAPRQGGVHCVDVKCHQFFVSVHSAIPHTSQKFNTCRDFRGDRQFVAAGHDGIGFDEGHVIRHRHARQHGQRKNQSLHLQSPVPRNSRHHRVRLRGCQHPRPAGTGAFRAGLGHTARGRGRPHLSAPFTSLLETRAGVTPRPLFRGR